MRSLAPSFQTPATDSCPASLQADALDQKYQALVARLTGSQSPALNFMAWYDWASHLGASPGKQLELLCMAQHHLQQFATLAKDGVVAHATRALHEPVSAQAHVLDDRRFRDPAWRQWPFSLMQQGYLLQEQWWKAATSNVRGVNPHHADWVAFAAQQWMSMLSPSNFFWSNPAVLQRTTEENGANLLRGWNNWLEDTQRKMSGAPPAITEHYVVGRDVAATPGKVVYRNQLMELIQYTPTTAQVHPEPVLIIPAWIMKYYILDLSQDNSLVRYLLDQGYTVFAISWKNPGAAEHHLGMEDYLQQGLYASLDAINTILPGAKVHATGYCLGGTLLSIGASAMARDDDNRLQSITLLAAQTDFSEPGELALFIDESQLNLLEAQMAERGYLDSSQMSAAFMWLRSFDLVWSRMVNEYLLGERSRSMDLMAWNADATRMPAHMHTEYLRQLFLHNDLARGKYLVDERPVVLNDVHLPMYVVGTESDHVAPWRSVYKIHLLTDTDITFVLTSSGHNAGIVTEPGHPNRHYRQMVRPAYGKYLSQEEWLDASQVTKGSWWESWTQWLEEHSGERVIPPAMGAAEAGYPVLEDAPGQYVMER